MKRILFVCTGNICRSPMAERFATALLGDDYIVSSAGFLPSGMPSTQDGIEVMKLRGHDLSTHRSSNIDGAIEPAPDLILTMTKEHKDLVSKTWPPLRDRTHTLKEFVKGPSKDQDVADPIGRGIEAYELCADEIEALIKRLPAQLFAPESPSS